MLQRILCAIVLSFLAMPVATSASGPVPPQMVIVTGDAEAVEYQRLADFKTAIGVPTEVRTVSWIVNNHPASDAAASIRAYLQEENLGGSLVYVLLGGDGEVVPYRIAHTTFFGGEDFPVDLYYSDLDGTWDADGDGVFGEGYMGSSDPGDEVEMHPDVFVGRLPSRNASEAALLVDKVLAYQQTPPAGFVETTLFAAGDGSTSNEGWVETMAQSFIDTYVPQDFSVDRLYEDNDNFPGADVLTGDALLESLRAGNHLSCVISPGTYTEFVAGGDPIGVADLLALDNGTRAGVCIFRTEASVSASGDAVAEAWLRAPNGGGVGAFAATDFYFSYSSWDRELLRLLWEEGEVHLGRLQAFSKEPFVLFASQDNVYRWSQFVLSLLGDPEMPLWTAEPAALTLAHDGHFLIGETYEVDVTSGGMPVEGARVALCQEGTAYSVGTTDVNGHVDLSFDAEHGEFTVGVWKKNHLPVIDDAFATSIAGIPEPPVVARAFPNPFRESTVIAYDVHETSDRVVIRVFDLRGTTVATLLDCDACRRGVVSWDGRDDLGARVPAGIYAYRVTSGSEQAGGKIVRIN